MTSTATLTRGNETVSLPVQEEAGSGAVTRSFGVPSHKIQTTGTPNPRSGPRVFSGSELITLNTRLYGDSGYTTALDLADMIKAHSGGAPISLSVPFNEFDPDMAVFPAAGQESALSLEYPTGGRMVTVSLALSRVGQVFGTSSGFRADTPRAPGNGPIELDDGSTSVSFAADDITVERSVGRPNAEVSRRYARFPTVKDRRESSFDGFELVLNHATNAVTKVSDLLTLFRQRQGRNTLNLRFNGTYGMGSFNVMPDGSDALRHARIGGRQGSEHQRVPSIKLRVVR